MRTLPPNLLLFILYLTLSHSIQAQSFELYPPSLGGYHRGDIEWGDYDNDGDFDILVSGCCNGADIFRNDQGTFQNLNMQFEQLEQGVSQWIDFDVDGDLDVFLNGQSICSLYRNDGNDTFVAISHNIPGLDYSEADWGDFDNDGDPDLILCGYKSETLEKYFTYIFKNHLNGEFEEVETILPGVSEGTVNWYDYNQDEVLDVFITGLSSDNSSISDVYKNLGNGQFLRVTNSIDYIFKNSSSVTGDYDNDGDIDFLISGSSQNGNASRIYRNEGNFLFNSFEIDIKGYDENALDWTDADGDGDLDIISQGSYWNNVKNQTEYHTQYFENDGNDVFKEITTHLEKLNSGSIQWCDLDNNDKVDALQTGQSNNGNFSTNVLIDVLEDSFNTEISALTGYTESSIDLADFDDDGKVDILINGRPQNNEDRTAIISYSDDNIFSERDTEYLGSNDCVSRWGDYDNDGDLDFIATADSKETKIYENQSGIFVETSYGLPTFGWSAEAEWIDYDKDGDLDVVLGGYFDSTEDCRTFLYKYENDSYSQFAEFSGICGENAIKVKDFDNDGYDDVLITGSRTGEFHKNNGDGTFILIDAPWKNDIRRRTTLALSDYDADGDIDIAISGAEDDDNFMHSAIYRNDGDFDFVNINAPLENVQSGGLAWGDLNNDSKPDLLVTGNNGSEPITKIYNNKGSDIFEDSDISLIDVEHSEVAIYDYNNDGINDIFLLGTDDNNYSRFLIYINKGGGDFININQGIQQVYLSDVAVDDYDHNGFNDFLIAGKQHASFNWGIEYPITRLYKNHGQNIIEELSTGIMDLQEGSASFEDIDNDDDLDILITGSNNNVLYTKLYRNAGSDAFIEIATPGITAVKYSSIDWSDYDQDGDPDLLISGYNGATGITKVFRNESGNSFTEMSFQLPGIQKGDASWADFNNDGLTDILIVGEHDNAELTTIYKNNGDGTFKNATNTIKDAKSSSVLLGDFDENGKEDILLTGNPWNSSEFANSYINHGDGILELKSELSYKIRDRSKLSSGDTDNDGDLDILFVGSDWNQNKSILYTNNGDYELAPSVNVIGEVWNSAVDFADFDQDNDLDIAFTGEMNSGGFTYIYSNNSEEKNTKPFPPQNLTSQMNGDQVELSWSSASDHETVQNSLTYNIKLISAFEGTVISPNTVHIDSAKMLLSDFGNSGYGIRHLIIGLLPGTYYWSVQAVDNGFLASEFAPIDTFDVEGEWPVPVVNTIFPRIADPGDTLTVLGEFFSLTAHNNEIKIGNKDALVISSTRHEIEFVAPDDQYGYLSFSLSVNEKLSISQDSIMIYGEQLWEKLESNIHSNLTCVEILSIDTIVAGADNGNLFKSDDRGQTWDSIYVADEEIRDIVHVTNGLVLLCGDRGLLQTSNDYGGSWTSISFETNDYTSFAIDQTNRLWLTDNTGIIKTSSDYGLSWETKYSGAFSINDIEFSSDLNGVAIMNDGSVLSTINGGETWTAKNIWNEPLGSISFVDGSEGYVSVEEKNQLFRTDDSGINWNVVLLDPDSTRISDIYATSGLLFAVGDYGFLFDGSKDWALQKPKTDNHLKAVSANIFRGLKSAYAVGDNGTILKLNQQIQGQPIILSTDGKETYSGDTLTLHAINVGTDPLQAHAFFNDIEGEIITIDGDNARIIVPSLLEKDLVAELTLEFNGLISESVSFNLLDRFVPQDVGLEYNSLTIEALDFDRDGYMDLVIGKQNVYEEIKLWRNVNGEHFEFYSNLSDEKLQVFEIEVADVNNDGYLDIYLNVYNQTGEYETHLYISDGVNKYTKYNNPLPGIDQGGLASGDMNNDGLVDLQGTGWNDVEQIDYRYILTNTGRGSNFHMTNHDQWGREVEVFDYDADLDNDLIYFTGGENMISVNHGSYFEFKSMVDSESKDSGEIELFDMENDGDIDFYESGWSHNKQAMDDVLYINTEGDLSTSKSLLSAFDRGELLSGDFDNDGYIDLFSFGNGNDNSGVGEIYKNMSGSSFVSIGADIMDPRNASGALFDMDNDGDLDLVVSGWGVKVQEEGSWFYRNDRVKKNTIPTKPLDLIAAEVKDSVFFSWSPATDLETDSEGLFYNLRVGTTLNGDEIMPSHANASTGQLLKPFKGNASQNLGWKLKGLEVGTYYCAVQAIDPAFGASEFSDVYEFEIHSEADIYLDPSVPDSIYAGITLNIQTVLGNSGLWGINDTVTIVSYFSNDASPDIAEVVDTLVINNFTDVDFDTLIFSFNIPITQPSGESFFIFDLDTKNKIDEFREDNNLVSIKTILKPDLFPPLIDMSICDVEFSPKDTIINCRAKIYDNSRLEQVYARYGTSEDLSQLSYELFSIDTDSICVIDIARADVFSAADYYVQFKAVDYFNNIGESEAHKITYTNPYQDPVILKVSSMKTYSGDTLTLYALNTGSDLSKIIITINDVNCTMISNSLDTIVVIVPTLLETEISAQLAINVNGVRSETVNLELLNRFIPEDVGLDYRALTMEAMDFDMDGYMDLVIGKQSWYQEIGLWRNVSGERFEYYGNVSDLKLHVKELEVADLNLDGFVDIVANAVNESGECHVYIYLSNRLGEFSLYDQTFSGFNNGGLAICDLNNDGRMDIIGTGWSDEVEDDSYIILNEIGSFTQEGKNFDGREVEVFDFDSDYDNDLFFATGGNDIIAINHGGTYEFVSLNFSSFMDNGEIELFDLENDGDIDFYNTGLDYDIWTSNGVLYTREQSDFENAEVQLSPIQSGELLSGDFDNNGFSDLFFFGEGENNFGIGEIYDNQQGSSWQNINADVMGVLNASAALFDMDNDGDLDLVVSGWGESTQDNGSWFYRNSRVKKNTNPTSPDHLIAFVFQDSVTFAWTPSSDKETDSKGLFYNLRVGTSPKGDDILPSHADAETGKLLIPQKGNAGQNLGWKLKGLEVGKYYYAVQAIDPAYGSSTFSEVREFEIHDEADISLHVMVQDSILPGAQLDFVAIVGNPGLDNINTSFTVNTYFSDDQVADASESLGVLEFASLSSGDYDTLDRSVNIHLDHPPGTNYILFDIDPENNVVEYSEDNNQVIDSIIVKQDITPPVIDLSICPVEFFPLDASVNCQATIYDNVKLDAVYFRYATESDLENKEDHLVSNTGSSIYSFNIPREDINSTDNFYIQYKAIDYFGNTTISEIHEIQYMPDKIDPEISETRVPPKYMMGDTLLEISCKAIDDSFIKRVEAKYFDQDFPNPPYSGIELDKAEQDMFYFEIDRTKLTDPKSISVIFKAFDYFNNQSVSDIITIPYVEDNDPPLIANVEYPSFYVDGESFVLRFIVTDLDKLKDVTVTYFADESARDTLNLSTTDSIYEVTINPELIGTPKDLFINIDATDASGNGTKTVLVYVPKELGSYQMNFEVGEKAEDYQLISFPFEYSNPKVRFYLNELGPLSEKKYGLINSDNWALYKYQGGQNIKLTLDDEIFRGVGYWLITTEVDQINLKVNSLNAPFNLPINAGWNLIGNPYPFKISWQDVLDENDQLKDQISQHINTYNKGTVSLRKNFEPFTGGFIWSETDGSLNILALPSGNNDRISKVGEYNTNEGEWFLPISIEAGGYKNEIGGIGMKNESLVGKDKFDEYNLPRFMKYIEPEFYGKDTDFKFLRNIVNVSDNYIWDLDISTNASDENLIIYWSENVQLRKNKLLMLYDLTTGWVANMTKKHTIHQEIKNLPTYRIMYGSESFIQANINQNKNSILRVYPIPTSGKITVDLVNAQDNTELKYKLINLDGRILLEGASDITKKGSISHFIDLDESKTELNTGLYFLILDFNNQTYQKKLLIN